MTGNASEKEPLPRETAVCGPEGPSPSQKGGYLGSVHFFKHFILTGLALAILIPTTMAIILGLLLGRTRAELAGLQKSARQAQPSVALSAKDWPDSSQAQALTVLPAKEWPDSIGYAVRREDSAENPQEDEGPKPEFPAYQALYPDLYAQPAERNSVNLEKAVYLSFDDGPSERTPELLEVLERYNVKATFFVVGQDSERDRQWLRDIVAEGHSIGVHSYSHNYATIYSSVEAFLDDFAREYYLIQEATGVSAQIFRFPGGSINAYNGHIYQEIISEMTRRGFVYFDWNRQTGDAVQSDIPAHTLVKNALDQASSMRRIFLLAHDSTRFKNVVEALPCIIEGYQEAGFTFHALTPEVRPVVYSYPD